MPFGPKNAPAYFQDMMNKMQPHLLFKKVFVFFDDIVVFSSTLAEVLANTREVLDCLDAND